MLIYLRTIYRIFHSSLYYKQLRNALILILAVHVVGMFGYIAISGGKASVIDSLYMVFITVATIGYGEVIDLTNNPSGRIFTMFVGFIGIGSLTYLFSAVTALVLDKNINHSYRRLRMERTIAAISGHYIICGAGRVGSYIADELLKTERPFVVIDPDEKVVEMHRERTGHQVALIGDASDDDILLGAGVERCRGVFAVSGDDSKNLVISLSARQLNPAARIVARVHDPRNADKTRRAGADEIVSPDYTGGMFLASAMLRPHAVNFLDMLLRTDNNLRVEEIVVPDSFAACTVADLGKSSEWMLVALRTGDDWVFNPAGDVRIGPGQVLVAIASPGGRRVLETAIGATGTLESAIPV